MVVNTKWHLSYLGKDFYKKNESIFLFCIVWHTLPRFRVGGRGAFEVDIKSARLMDRNLWIESCFPPTAAVPFAMESVRSHADALILGETGRVRQSMATSDNRPDRSIDDLFRQTPVPSQFERVELKSHAVDGSGSLLFWLGKCFVEIEDPLIRGLYLVFLRTGRARDSWRSLSELFLRFLLANWMELKCNITLEIGNWKRNYALNWFG